MRLDLRMVILAGQCAALLFVLPAVQDRRACDCVPWTSLFSTSSALLLQSSLPSGLARGFNLSAFIFVSVHGLLQSACMHGLWPAHGLYSQLGGGGPSDNAIWRQAVLLPPCTAASHWLLCWCLKLGLDGVLGQPHAWHGSLAMLNALCFG